MAVLETRYLELHEPINHEELRAVLRTVYQTRPGEPDRDDTVEHGIVSTEIGKIISNHEKLKDQFNDNRTLNLSIIPDEVSREITKIFTPLDDEMDLVRKWVKLGVHLASAVDYYMVNIKGLTQKEWAEERGVTPQAISQNIKTAEESLEFEENKLIDTSSVESK